MWHDFSEDPSCSGEYLCCYLRKNKPYYFFHTYNKTHECWIDLRKSGSDVPDLWMRIPDPKEEENLEQRIKELLGDGIETKHGEQVLRTLSLIALLDSYINYFKTGKIELGDWTKWLKK